jgi:hypothetical protein
LLNVLNAQSREQERSVVYRYGACPRKPDDRARARAPGCGERARRFVARRAWIPRAEGAPRKRAVSTGELVLALLDAAELEVLEFSEELAQVRRVRELAAERFAGRPLPAIDPRHLAFTIGVIAAMVGSDFACPGPASLCFALLSPSALAEYERAAGFVRGIRECGAERN